MKYRMNRQRAALGIFLLALTSMCATAPAVLAARESFGQKILPLDCIFTVVNQGTGELHYVTPAACGVVTPPVSGGQQIGSGQTESGSQTGAYGGISSAGGAGVGTSASGTNTNDSRAFLTSQGSSYWQPIATTTSSYASQSQRKALSKPKVSGPAVVTGTLFIIGLIAFVAVLA